MRSSARRSVVMAVLALAGIARADVWDVQTQNDNTVLSTQNELVHGSDQLHDLGTLPGGVDDQDWYRLSQAPFSSYEAVVDAASGDFEIFLALNRTDALGALLQPSVATGLGFARSLRFANDTASVVNSERLMVTAPACGGFCGADDVYRLRFYETTYAIPRFNNSNGQVTVLIIQNPTNYTISGKAHFWRAVGTFLVSHIFSLAPKNTLVLQTNTIAPGESGAITVTHNGRYGDLAGKAVALEPATGFSFDSPMLPRVR